MVVAMKGNSSNLNGNNNCSLKGSSSKHQVDMQRKRMKKKYKHKKKHNARRPKKKMGPKCELGPLCVVAAWHIGFNGDLF
jgi:hypothetical protein